MQSQTEHQGTTADNGAGTQRAADQHLAQTSLGPHKVQHRQVVLQIRLLLPWSTGCRLPSSKSPPLPGRSLKTASALPGPTCHNGGFRTQRCRTPSGFGASTSEYPHLANSHSPSWPAPRRRTTRHRNRPSCLRQRRRAEAARARSLLLHPHRGPARQHSRCPDPQQGLAQEEDASIHPVTHGESTSRQARR